MSKQPSPIKVPDLYPEITSQKLDEKLVTVLRQQGKNPTALQQELDTVIASGDMRKKAGLLEHYAALSDRVNGNSAATSYLTSRRRLLDTEQANATGSVSGSQALVGLTGNGFVDLAESLPKLAVAAYQGVKGDNKSWEKANKSVENYFAPLRTFVSDDYQKGLASYSSEDGLDLNLDAKSLIGTVGSLAGFILPGFLTAGAGSLATIGTRAGLKAAQLAGDAVKIAQASAKLGKAGKIVEGVTGMSSFLQMFPGYQKEGIEAGLSMRDATLLAIPMAGINGWIETANVGALTKALGMSDDVAKQAIREVTTQELRSALQGMAGKALTPDAFMDVAQGAAQAALGRITRPKEMSMIGRMAGAVRRRVGTGFREQGITEGGEEFFQSLVENASRQIYNNFGAAKGATEGNGKFKDPTLGNYLFDGIYGTLLGTIVGTGMGTIIQSKKLDPTVFGYINADMRMQLAKGVPFEDAVQKLKINKVLDGALAEGKLDDAGHQELRQTIGRMADTAREFADVEDFTDSDRYLMFKMSESRNQSTLDSESVNGLKSEYEAVNSQLQAGGLSTADQLKAELRKSALVKQLGGQITDPNGNPTDIFQAEKFVSDRAGEFENIAEQTLKQYAGESDRKAIKNFFNNNYATWQKKYGQLNQYEDPFKPEQVVVDPLTQETLAFDSDKKFFRVVKPVGGEIKTPAHINEQGKFVPSVREPMDYDYSEPVSDIARHLDLTQTLADDADPLTQSATAYEPVDNSPEAGWLRDGEQLLNTLTVAKAAGDKSVKNAVKQAKGLATAFLTDSAFLANDATYGPAYTKLAADLQSVVGSAGNQTTVPGTQQASSTAQATSTQTVHGAQLPKDLSQAKPRYGYQGINFMVRFASDVDKALYVTSQTIPSKRDAEYRRFLTQLGYNNSEINREGVNVRNTIKAKAQSAVLSGGQSGDSLKMSSPIAAEPASAGQAAPAPTTQSPVVSPQPQPSVTSTNGQTAQPSIAPDVQQPTPEPPTIESEYARNVELNGAIQSANEAESELEQALDNVSDAISADGIPNVGTIEQLADALARAIAATAEATGSTGTDVEQESVDQSDTAAAAEFPESSNAEVILPEGPLTLQDALTALADARGQQVADQFESGLMRVLRYPKFLQESMLFYGTPPEPKTATGRRSTKRRPKRDTRMRLPLDFFQSAAEVLAGQRKEQTSPAADNVLRKFLSVFLDGGVEIDDRVSGQRAFLSLDQLADTAAITEEMIPDGVEDILPEAFLAADELLATLSDQDIDAILSVVDEMEGSNPDSWLIALNDALKNAFPPLTDSVLTSIDNVVQEYMDAQENIIFDNGDDTDPGYQRAVSEYGTAQRGIQSAIGIGQTESPDDFGDTGFEQDERSTVPDTGSTIQGELAAAGEQFQPERIDITPEQFESAVTAAESAGRSAIEERPAPVDETSADQPADQTIETLESAVAALEAPKVTPPKPDRIYEPVSDYQYRAFIAKPDAETGYQLGETTLRGIAQRIAQGTPSKRDLDIYERREDQIKPFLPEPETLPAEQISEVLDTIEEAISQEASQDPITASAVAPLDIELADLSLQERALSDELGDEESRPMAEQTQDELDQVREKKQSVRKKKIEIVEQVAAEPAPVDKLQQKLDDLDEEEIALAKRLSAKLKALRTNLNSNPFGDTELMTIVGDYFALKIKKGIYGFAKIARDFVRVNGAMHPDDFKVLRGVYGYYRESADDDVADQMDDSKAIRAISLESINDVLTPAAIEAPVVEEVSTPVTELAETSTEELVPEPVMTPAESNDLGDRLKLSKRKVDMLQSLSEKNSTNINIKYELGNARTQLDIVLAEATANVGNLPASTREQLATIEAELNNVNRLIEKIYDANGATEADDAEKGSLAPERKFKAALTKFSRQMAGRLGWNHDTDKTGKVIYSWTNIPPAGGNGGFTLWHPSGKVGVYVSFTANKLDFSGAGYGDTLTIEDRILWRLTTPENKSSGKTNRYTELTAAPYAFSDQVTAAANDFLASLPDDGTRESTNTLDSPASASTGLQFGLFDGAVASPSTTTGRSASGRNKVSSNRTGSTGKGKVTSGSNGNSAGDLGGTLNVGSGSGADAGAGVQGNNGAGETATDPVSTTDTGTADEQTVVETSAPVFAPAPEINLNPNHFYITDDTVIVPKGRVAKIRANMAAIKLMKELVEAGRPATADEKAVLVQYTGWGGLKAVLNQPRLNSYNQAVENLAKASYGASTFWMRQKAEHQAWYDENGKFAQDLLDTLTKEEYQDAVNSVINAHYTDRPVIKAIWKYVQDMGFKGGRTLEPATGAGHFIGLMPDELVKNSQWWGTELDTVTGNIAKLLYPDADIQVKGFEAVPQRSHFYDLVISNVPFGQTAPFDASHQDLSKFNLHNYFIAKSIRLAKPGGLVAVVTSAYTMDSSDTSFREWVSNNGNADLIGAIRLPSNAFKENAGTEVVTDILFFRKRDGSETEPGESIRSLKPLFDQQRSTGEMATIIDENGQQQEVPVSKTLTYRVNEYFVRNPEKMLGVPKFAFDAKSGGLYNDEENTLEAPEGENTMQRLADELATLPRNITDSRALTSKDASGGYSTKRAGALYRNESGKIVKSADGVEEALDLTSSVKISGKSYTFKTVYGDYLDLKVGVQNLRALEAKGTTEAEEAKMTELRRKLRLNYTTFVAKYGTLNRNAQKIGFLEDADVEFAQVAGLEMVARDPLTNKYNHTPSQILNQRVQFPPKLPTTAENVQDSLTVSLAYKSKIDLPWMAELLNQPEESIQASLLADGLAFMDPDTGLLEDRESYLSGNVRHKLAQAKAQAETDQSYEPNVIALEAVIPKTIPISLIDFRIGSSWIPSDIYQEFLASIGINNGKVNYLPATQSFSISGTATPRSETLGTPRISAIELIDKALNLKQPIIMDRFKDENGNKQEVKNINDTAAAQDKMMEIMGKFVDYVKDTPALARIAESTYNEKYNSLVAKRYMQPPFTSFPGANPKVQLRQHQIRAAQRALVDSVLFAHGVGTGKTFTMITAAMEMKRLGLANKPMIVVQNSTLENFAAAWRFLYPGANILVPSGNDTDSENRQRFLQRMAYNNWDGVIIPQSFMALIPDNQDRIDALVQEQIDMIQNALNDTDENEEKATAQNLKARLKALEKQRDSQMEKEQKKKQKTVADSAREALKITKKVSKQASRRTDATMTFEELGVDGLFIDEAHEYKKFGFYTKMGNVKGIDTASSQKALSAMLKVKWVQERNKGRNVVLATGTPISNTMAELWTMLKYVAPQLVKEFGIDNFDEFAANFGSVDPSLEFTAAGKFKIVDRFKRYINMPELNAIFKQNVDVVLGEEVFSKEDNTLPKLKNGKFTFIELEMSPELKNYMDYVKKVLMNWENLPGAEKRKLKHIPLVMFTRAKQAAIDVRLVDPAMETDNSKVHAVAENVIKRYEMTNSYKGTQLIFSNSIASAEAKEKYMDEEQTMINPLYGKGQFNLYDAIIDELVKGGIPRTEIAVVPEDAKKREAVFLKVRSGEIRVVLGSTERLGVGVNIQDRIQSVHHVDAPVRPMDFEQRNGRILRQGNLHAEWGKDVEVVTYGVKKTLDATAYQRLAFKQEFINQILKGDSTERSQNDEADEDDTSAMGFQEMMASLSGSQYVQLQQQRKFELSKVKMAQSNWERGQIEAKGMIQSAERSIAKYTALLPGMETQLAQVNSAFPEGKVELNSFQLENGELVEGEAAKEALADTLNGLLADAVQKLPTSRFIKINGFGMKVGWTIVFDNEKGRDGVSLYYEKGDNFRGFMKNMTGFMTSIRAAINRVEVAPSVTRNNIVKSQETIDAFSEELKKPFKDGAKLVALENEVADLEEKMKAEFEQEAADLENNADESEDLGLDADMGFQLQQPSQPSNPATDAFVQRVAQSFPGVSVVSNPNAYEQALIESGAADLLGEVRPLGFAWNNRVYLSPDATENTVLHEFGHIWTNIVKTTNPELYAQGIKLVGRSDYMARVKADKYYSTLPPDQQLDEALAMAIGDEGVGFVSGPQRMSFGEWLMNLWNGLKQALGLGTDPANMTLRDFVGQAVEQMTSGQPMQAPADQAQAVPVSAPQFQLPPGVVPQSIKEMQADAESRYQTIPVLAIGAGVNPDLWVTPLKEWTKEDKDYAKNVQKITGWQLSAPETLKYTRPSDLFHMADGSAVRLEGYQVNQILKDGFVSAYENESARGRLFRTVVDRMKSWTNLESFLDLIDDAAGTIGGLIKNLKRTSARRAAYAQVVLEPLRQDVEKKMAAFSLRTGNSMETVKAMTVTTWDYDETGAVIQRDVEIPVAVGMELALLAETQIETYGEASHIVNTAPTANQLYRPNADGSRTRWQKGAVYYDQETDTTHYLLLDAAQFDQMRDRFETGNGAFDGEADAYAALQTFYNQAEVVKLLEEENGFLNPDREFERVKEYYPIRTFNGQQDARTQSRGFSRTLDESRQLIARQSAADAVLIRDPITTMNDYEGSVVDILEHGRLVENLNSLKNGIESDYTGPKKQYLISTIEKQRDVLQNHRKKRAEAYEQRGFVHWLESSMRRYTQSVFSLNVGLPLKQTGTYAAALGQGIIADEFLRSSEAAGVLTQLTAGAYRDWEAPATVVNGTDQGYQGSLSGMDTQERPFMEEIFGMNMADELSKTRQAKRFATVLDRLTHSQTLFTGDVEWSDMGLNSRTLTNGQKMLRQFDEWNTEYGLAAMKRADRAVILAYYTAAKMQANSEGLAEGTDEFWDRVADLTERTVYATNQMSNLAEQTPMQTSTDFVAKILGLYSGQQQKLLNTVMQSLNRYVKTGEGSAEAKAALTQMAKTFGWAVVFNAAWVAGISAGSAALMAILSGDEPKPWEETKRRIGFDFMRNIAGTVPGLGQQAVEYWISQLDDRPGEDALLQITAAENLQTGLDIIGGMAKYITEEDDSKRDKALDSVIYDVTDFTSKATGTPASVVKLVREWITTDKDDLEEDE